MANGVQLSQKSADEILDIIDCYIDVREAVANEKFESWWTEKHEYLGIPESAKEYCRLTYISSRECY